MGDDWWADALITQDCPYAHDDPDHDNPPLLHEVGEQELPHKFKLSMSGLNPFAGMMGGGLGSPAMTAVLLNSVTGKNGMNEENRKQVLQAVAASMGMSAESLQSMEPEQLQSVLQMAAMRGLGGGPGAEAVQQMMAASGLPPAAVMQMMAAGGGQGPEALQAVMQMAAAGGLPPAALQGMMASMAAGGEGGDT